jgi:multidrug efflux pump subunit AcrB
MKIDASSLPVCLVTLKGEGLERGAIARPRPVHVRNQMAGMPGASVPPAFGGRYRQIMVYVDPLKLEAHQLSVMDVVRRQRSQPDSAGGRREDRALRLQRLCQQPDQQDDDLNIR